MQEKSIFFSILVFMSSWFSFDSWQFFSFVGTGLLKLNQY